MRLQVNHLENRGSNLVDRLLWACAIVVAGAEGYKVNLPLGEGGGQLTYVGSSKLAFFFLPRIIKLGIMVYLDKITNKSCEEMA